MIRRILLALLAFIVAGPVTAWGKRDFPSTAIRIKLTSGSGRVPDAMFKQPLGREIAVIVAVKMALIFVAGLLVFGPAQRPVVDAASVRTLLLAEPAGLSFTPGP